MANLGTEMKEIIAAKKRRRQQLARESFPEKIRKLVELQKMLAPLERKRGRNVRVWEID
jgi:hypothetical protein